MYYLMFANVNNNYLYIPLLIGFTDGFVSILLAVLMGDVFVLLHIPEPRNEFLHRALFGSDVGDDTST